MTDDDPLTHLGEGAAQLHEMFVTMMKIGFTEDQALRFLAYLMAERMKEE